MFVPRSNYRIFERLGKWTAENAEEEGNITKLTEAKVWCKRIEFIIGHFSFIRFHLLNSHWSHR